MKRTSLFVCLAAVALMVTGCPHNEYIVQLKPQGSGVERTLVFYCADGVNTNTGAPNYQAFDPSELAAITGQYPSGGMTNDGDRHVACGLFTNQLPDDVGGAGVYTHMASTLGGAGFYSERFRGTDDFASLAERHFKAADQITDLMIGWSQAELGREPGYDKLHQFLDEDFRRDLKNFSSYWWEGQLVSAYKTNAVEEFIVRFGQYLWEHGYFKIEEIPQLVQAANDNGSQGLMPWIQRLVADKMGVPSTNPIPASLAFLANETTSGKSLDQYLSGTELYRAKIKEWEVAKKLAPDTKRPEPEKALDDVVSNLIEFDLFGHPDHLIVRLALTGPPLHTNGRWDETVKQVLWETDIEERTNATHVPFVCYASWVQADEVFQVKHFGKTAIAGDDLVQYCLWRNSLDSQRGEEWDTFIATLEPDAGLTAKLAAFRFAGEPVTLTNSQQNGSSSSSYACDLLTKALR